MSQTYIRIAERGVIADEMIFHKKISKSVKCFQMNRSFGCITLLRCEENRCTFLTLTKGYTPETSVYFFEGICYFLVFFVMKLSLLHLSKFKCHHSIHHSLKRSAWGLALVINISLFLVGEQRRRENRNKTATNPGPVSRKSRGNFPGCLPTSSPGWVACVADALNLRARAPATTQATFRALKAVFWLPCLHSR